MQAEQRLFNQVENINMKNPHSWGKSNREERTGERVINGIFPILGRISSACILFPAVVQTSRLHMNIWRHL